MQLAGEAAACDLRDCAPADRLHVAEVFAVRRSFDSKRTWTFSLAFMASPSVNAKKRTNGCFHFLGSRQQNQITGSLPGGWKQRVAFGAAIMHEPAGCCFLDEPTSGVDPLARRAFWKMINRLADTGTAILVTTHYLEESEQCNRLGLMVAGELVAEGTPSEQSRRADRSICWSSSSTSPRRAADLLKEDWSAWRVSLFGTEAARHH